MTRQTIPWGDTGSNATLQKMRSIANDAIKLPVVVETAHTIIRGAMPRDQRVMSFVIRSWLAQSFRFVNDPLGVELLRTPDYLLRQYHTQGYMSGDCDDVAILGAALGKAVGIPAKFVAIGFSNYGPLAHVYSLLVPSGNFRVSLDVTKPFQTDAQVRRRLEISV